MPKNSYPSRGHVAGDSTDNLRNERISELRKKGQLVRLKPTLFLAKAELRKITLDRGEKSLAEFMEGLLRGAKSYPSGKEISGPGTDNFAL